MVSIVAFSVCTRELDPFPRHFENYKDINEVVNRLVTLIEEAVAKNFPLSKPATLCFFW
jgi:hypothetical protein